MKTFILILILFTQPIFSKTPTQTLTDFDKLTQASNVEGSWKLFTKFDNHPKEVTEYLRKRVQRSIKLASQGWRFEILEEKVIGNSAVVIINSVIDSTNDHESEKGVKAKFDPQIAYMTKQNGEWKVFPPAHGIKYLKELLSKDTTKEFNELEKWFEARKTELIKKNNPGKKMEEKSQ